MNHPDSTLTPRSHSEGLPALYDPALAQTRVQRPVTAPRSSGRCPWAAVAIAAFAISTLLNTHHAPWHVSGPSPEPRMSVEAAPDMMGTWVGTFGGGDRPALLAVTGQYGDAFQGVLVSRVGYGTYKVQVEGTIDQAGVRLQETDTLSTPFLGMWALGTDTGSFSPDGLLMAGSGDDSAGQHYNWAFSHRSDSVIIPND